MATPAETSETARVQPPTAPPAAAPPVLSYSAPGQLPADWVSTLTVHRIDPARAGELRNRVVLHVGLNVVFGWALASFATWFIWLKVVGLHSVIGATFVGMIVGYMRGVRLWLANRKVISGYVLQLSDLGLVRKVPGLADMQLQRADVTRLAENRRGLVLHTRYRLRFILVPRQLEDFATVRQRLTHWAPLTSSRRDLLVALLRYAGLTAYIGLYAGTIATTRIVLLIPMALLCSGVLIMAAVVAQRSPNYPRSQKILTWTVMPVACLMVWAVVALRVVSRAPTTGPTPLPAATAPRL